MKWVGKLEQPNIVRALDANDDRGIHYLVMELVERCDLQQRLKTAAPPAVKEVCRWIYDATLALEYAHRAGLVHRDNKPSNLFLTPDGQIKIFDLGLARLILVELARPLQPRSHKPNQSP